MPLLTTDRALLTAFREGEREALERVYGHYAPKVAEFLRGGFGIQTRGDMVHFGGFRRAFELENAVQEVFARAFSARARGGYDGLRPFTNYLFAIAKNYVVDEYRRRDAALRRFESADGDAELETVPAEGDGVDPAVAAEEREVTRLLGEFLTRCDEKLRRYYELRCKGQRTQDEVAAEMGLTRIQVRRIEARFRRDLLAHLKGEGYLSGFKERRVALIAPGASLLFALLLGGGHGL